MILKKEEIYDYLYETKKQERIPRIFFTVPKLISNSFFCININDVNQIKKSSERFGTVFFLFIFNNVFIYDKEKLKYSRHINTYETNVLLQKELYLYMNRRWPIHSIILTYTLHSYITIPFY